MTCKPAVDRPENRFRLIEARAMRHPSPWTMGGWFAFLAILALSGCSTNGGETPQNKGIGVVEENQPDLQLGRYRALLIGINEYQHWPSLRYAESDVRELKEVLVGRYTFDPDDVTVLLGSQATESRILNEIHRFLEDAAETDNLLIYYSGHGNLDPLTENGYWIPYDGGLKDESTWVAFTSVRTLMTASKLAAQSVLLITDSCYGGSLTRSGPTPGMPTPEEGELYQAGLRKLIGKKSRQIIASGGFETVPDKSDFAAALKQALTTNEYRLVDLEYLFFFQIYPAMRLAGSQNPLMERLKTGVDLDGQFILERAGAKGESAKTEPLFWESIRDKGNVNLFNEYLSRWPDGLHAEEARQWVASHGETGTETVEVTFWESIRNSGNPGLFEEYLRRWPNGDFAVIARAELQRLRPPPASLIQVPQLVGLTQEKAKEQVLVAKLALDTIDQKESGEPSGTVIAQRPAAGQEVPVGTEVRLVISTGGVEAPNVVGIDLESATRRLAASSLDAKPLRWVVRGKPGIVIDQVPKAGTFVASGAALYLTVTGVEVPSVLGLDLRTALTKIQDSGLSRGPVTGGANGRVAVQDPVASVVVPSGSSVKLELRESSNPVPPRIGILAHAAGPLVATLSLSAPAQTSPKEGAVFNVFPRKTTLAWEPVRGASTYGVEIEIKSGNWRPWIDRAGLTTTSYSFSFVGAQPGRWRVWAIDGNGVAGAKSAWREFRYLR